MASAGARAYNEGPRAEPPMEFREGGEAPRSWWHFSTGGHIFCAVLHLVVVADLTEATGLRRTFDTAAILSVNDQMALVSPT